MKVLKSMFLSLILLTLSTSLAFAAGSTKITAKRDGKIEFVTIAWTSDASGDVSSAGSYNTRGGTLYAFLYDPETGVTDLWDFTLEASWVVLTESSSRTIELVDVTGGDGTNLSNSTDGDYVSLGSPVGLPSCTLTPTVAGAGNAQSGTIVLLIWNE